MSCACTGRFTFRVSNTLLTPVPFYATLASMTTETTREFLQRLWALQAEAGVTNAQLARILGCGASYVRHLKAGRRKVIGLRIALAAARRFPELGVFLLAEFPVENDNAPLGNTEAEEGAGQ